MMRISILLFFAGSALVLLSFFAENTLVKPLYIRVHAARSAVIGMQTGEITEQDVGFNYLIEFLKEIKPAISDKDIRKVSKGKIEGRSEYLNGESRTFFELEIATQEGTEKVMIENLDEEFTEYFITRPRLVYKWRLLLAGILIQGLSLSKKADKIITTEKLSKTLKRKYKKVISFLS